MKLPLSIVATEPHYYKIKDADGMLIHQFVTDDAASDIEELELLTWRKVLGEINCESFSYSLDARYDILRKVVGI